MLVLSPNLSIYLFIFLTFNAAEMDSCALGVTMFIDA